MHKIILTLLILCSVHFVAMAEGNVDSTLIKDNEDTVLTDDIGDEEVKLLDWGILFDVSYGFDILTEGGGYSLSSFNEHQLLTLRFTTVELQTKDKFLIRNGNLTTGYEYSHYTEGGLLYGYLFSNGIVSGSVSGGFGLVWSDSNYGEPVAGFSFELNSLIQVIRYAAVGVKVFGNISSDSFVAVQFCLRIGAVTQ